MKETEKTTLSKNGFRGYFYEAASEACMIVLLGDEGNDFMSKACAKWLVKVQNCNALCIALRQKRTDDTGLHRWKLEYIEAAVLWLREKGFRKISIFGMSMQGTLALSAAARIPAFSLVIGLTPCDFVPWGFYHGKIGKDRHAEWSSETSPFTWRGQELPFQPAFLSKNNYWQLYLKEKKKHKEMHTITFFERSERKRPVPPECFIPVENISCPLVLVGAADDSMWNAKKYILRMKQRLEEKNFPYPLKVLLYPYGTHLIFPEKMLMGAVPLFGGLVSSLFASGRKHPKECKAARREIEKQLTEIFRRWKAEER